MAAWVLVLVVLGAVVVGGGLLGPGPLRVSVLVAVLVLAGLWWGAGDAPALLAGARPAGASGRPDLDGSLRVLAERGGVRAPRLDLSPVREPFVFTTGRSRRGARITMSAGSLVLLDRDEVDAVLAEEIARVHAGGTFAATVAVLAASANVLAARVLVGARDATGERLVTPARVVAMLLVGRGRGADERAVPLPCGARVKLDAALAVDGPRSSCAVVRALALVQRAVAPSPRL